MHASSLENMWTCYRRYVAGGPLESQAETTILDVGGADVNGNYKEVFARPPFVYRVADIAAGPGTDIVLTDSYTIPVPDASVDIVISGQAFEHIDFFWRTFEEMTRVLQPRGLIFLIVPSAGPIHRYPVDCYRFLPDAFSALAKHVQFRLVESWMDERGPWRDVVGVFCRADACPDKRSTSVALPIPLEWNGEPGSSEEEITKGSAHYLEILDRLHRDLTPAHYLEIGVRHGVSLSLARGPATGIDPNPQINVDIPNTTRIVRLTSDDFFAEYSGGVMPDLVFIDGMHLLEYALRDFMHSERYAAPGAVVLIDDVFPNHPTQALRERKTRVWTGDVWRIIEILRRYRPDLFIVSLDAAPTGLLLIAGLDPTNRVLWDNYNPIVREARELPGPPQSVIARAEAIDPAGEGFHNIIEVLKDPRLAKCSPRQMASQLQQALRGARNALQSNVFSPPKLSVIIVSYNMARELPRTIRSFSPAMQRNIDAEDYEIILIDNGSTQPIEVAELLDLMPNLTVHRHPSPTPSPVPAINFGLQVARGDLVGVCIDGARMASPGILARALAASRLHEWPIIGTIAFHLGPDIQMESVKRGYNQAVEDELLAHSGWELDGYRLFSIAALAGSSAGGWFDVPEESNAFFLRREHWLKMGGWDERFVTPGGGLANLDIWSRVCADADGELIMLLGEATFHQFHGGIATNNPDQSQIQALFHDEYLRLRGHSYVRPTRQALYFGSLPDIVRTSLKYSASRS